MVYVPFVHANGDGQGLQLNKGDVTFTGVTGGLSEQQSDRIWIWNPARLSYTTFFYYNDGSEEGWVDDSNAEYIEDNKGWENGIPQGTAFYYKAKSNGKAKSITFTSPLSSTKTAE